MNALPPSPYKGLAAFGDSHLDAMLFFGRERECEGIVANLLASRLTILYGASGVGKSSLLRAGVAQGLRELGDGVVVVHDSWADDPETGVIASLHAADPQLGPTAGLVDTVAAAAQRYGQVFLLLDQFEEYFLHHGANGPLVDALPELLRRPGLRVNVLIALRADALADLDAFAGRMPDLFGNLLRLDRLDRSAARAAVLGPLERYGELAGAAYAAEDALVDELLDQVAVGRVDLGGTGDTPVSFEHVEAPFLQLVLERLWSEEAAAGSHLLRLETFHRLGGAEPILREHVYGTLDRLPSAEQDAAARLIRQLVTSSGAKTSYSAADLADYAAVDPNRLLTLLALLARERIVRTVEGLAGGPARYEIFHDVLATPLLAWRAAHELERERLSAHRQRRRLLALVAAAFIALLVVAGIAIFAFTQRSTARSEARRAHARELAADALAEIPSNPTSSLALALQAAKTAAETDTEAVLRSSLLAMRERRVARLGRAIVAARFAPSTNDLLLASNNGTVGVYDPTGKRITHIPRQPPLTNAVWSPDGKLFATGTENGKVVLWRASDGHIVREVQTKAPIAVLAWTPRGVLIGSGARIVVLLPSLRGHARALRVNGAVVAAMLGPTGKLLAVATRRKGQITTRVLDALTGRVRYTLPERGIGSLIFSADGRLLVTGSTDKTARIWNAPTGRLLHVLPQRGYVLAESFSPDGASLVTSSADGTAAVWDVDTGERVLLLVGATGIAEDAAFSPDGKEIAVAFGDRIARIYNAQNGELLAPLAGHADAVTSIGYNAAGDTIVTGSEDGTARLWSTNAGDQLATIDRRATSVTALFAGSDVLSAGGRQLRVLTEGGRRIETIRTPKPIVAVAAQGVSLAAADNAGDLTRATLAGATTMTRGLDVSALAFASDGTLITGSRDGTIRIWRSPARPRLLHIAGSVASISATKDSFAVRTADGSVRIYSLAGKLLTKLGKHVQIATLSPDGTILATATGREADLWSATTGKRLHRLVGHTSLVTDVEFSPDGSTLVTASDDHDGRLWDVASGRLLYVLRGHFFPVRTASFSPDGRWVVTASQFTAGLWDTTTGQLVFYLQGHTLPLTGATFSPDGNWILTASEDGTARIARCDVCRNLAGLEQLATQRLHDIGSSAAR